MLLETHPCAPAPRAATVTGLKSCISVFLASEVSMSPGTDHDNDAARQERAIRSLTDCSDASLDKVRGLFTVEFARLEQGAKVRRYLHVLTTSRVRAMLYRTGEARRPK